MNLNRLSEEDRDIFLRLPVTAAQQLRLYEILVRDAEAKSSGLRESKDEKNDASKGDDSKCVRKDDVGDAGDRDTRRSTDSTR